MKEQLLTSKLCMPVTACNTIKRRELLEQIYRMPEPVIILHAGTGYGKTTLMTEYFQTYGLSCSWYRLGRTDDDMNRFLYYFEALLQRQVRHFCIHTDISDWSGTKMEFVVYQILEQLESWKGRLNIVLDDFQYIQNPLIFEFLTLFIRYMGEGIRIFILIKGRFPGFLTCFVFQDKAAVLETNDLKITDAELNHYIREQETGLKSEWDVKHILEWTEGWVVAVNYVLHRKQEKDENRANIFEYILFEIFRFLSVQQQVFMRESAVLTTITSAGCHNILGEEKAEEWLDFFADQQMLTERTGLREYRYHPVLQDFLSRQVTKERKEEIQNRETEYLLISTNQQKTSCCVQAERNYPAGTLSLKKSPNMKVSLTLTCFGSIQIHAGQKQNMIHWRTRKTKEMFAYFWEQGERAISKDEIMEALWQDGNGQRLETLFHTTLSYLKRTFSEIGISDLIQMDNKRYTMKQYCLESDVQRLKQMYGKWKRGMDEVDVEQGFRELLDIYRGDYMEELDGSWVIVSREAYQNIYLQCCEMLVNQAYSVQNYDLAVQILEQALKSDPYSDQLNGMLLKNLCAMGKFQVAKQQYERHNRLLREELNIGIGRQVREVYQNTILRRIG